MKNWDHDHDCLKHSPSGPSLDYRSAVGASKILPGFKSHLNAPVSIIHTVEISGRSSPRIQRHLHALHNAEGIQPELFHEVFLLPEPDAVLARAGTIHLKRSVNHVVHALLDALHFFGVVFVVHDALVEVPVADVPEDASKHSEVVHFLLRDLYTVLDLVGSRRITGG